MDQLKDEDIRTEDQGSGGTPTPEREQDADGVDQADEVDDKDQTDEADAGDADDDATDEDADQEDA